MQRILDGMGVKYLAQKGFLRDRFFIVAFYLPQYRLAIDIGPPEGAKADYLAKQGVRMMRFGVGDCIADAAKVERQIREAMATGLGAGISP